MTKLSRREAVLLAIDRYWWRHGYAPSVRDIQRAAGISSTNVVAYWLDILAREGLISRQLRLARTVRLTAKGQQVIDTRRDDAQD